MSAETATNVVPMTNIVNPINNIVVVEKKPRKKRETKPKGQQITAVTVEKAIDNVMEAEKVVENVPEEVKKEVPQKSGGSGAQKHVFLSSIPADVKENYKLYMRTIQASALRTLSEVLREILVDVNIRFDSSGFTIMTISKKHKAIIHLKLNADKFEDYWCSENFTIGVSMISFHKLLKTISNSDIVSFFVTKNDSHKLGIKIENKEKKIVDTSMLKLLDLDDQTIEIPPITFESIFNMPCVDFHKHCRDLATISDMVDIKILGNGEVFSMSCVGDFAEKEIQIGEEDAKNKLGTNVKSALIGQFLIKYLNLFCKSASLCPSVSICLKEDFPILLIFSVANLGSLRFCLSPGPE